MTFATLFKFLSFHKKVLTASILLLSLVNAIAELVLVAVVSILITKAISGSSENSIGGLEIVTQSFGIQNVEFTFFTYLYIFTGFFFWRIFFLYFSVQGSKKIALNLSFNAFFNTTRLPAITKFSLPDLTTVITNKVNASVNGIILSTFNIVIAMVACSLLVLVVSVSVGEDIIPAIGLIFLGYLFLLTLLRKRIERFSGQVASSVVLASSTIMYAYQNRGVVKISNETIQEKLFKKFVEVDHTSKNAIAMIRFYQEMARPIFDFVFNLTLAYFAFSITLNGTNNLENLILIVVATVRIVPYIQNAYRGVITYRGAIASANLLIEVLETENNGENIEEPKPAVIAKSLDQNFHIQFKNLCVHSDNHQIRYGNLDLQVMNGLFCVYGPSGSGKTTFLNILLGMQDYTGSFYIRYPKNNMQKQPLGYCPQFVWLFRGSLKENLQSFIDEEIDMMDKSYLISQIQKSGFLEVNKESLEKFLNRQIGDNGHGLSGGEIKRIGILRALLAKPHILILDEPTSGLDQEMAAHICKDLSKIAKEMLILVVTHDENFLNHGKILIDLNRSGPQ